MDIYDISFILTETSTDHDQGTDHIDHIDHPDHPDHIDHADYLDHPDHVDHVDHPDHIDHIDHAIYLDHPDHIDHVDHVDHPDHVDHVDYTNEFQTDTMIQEGSTPAPFLLLLSSALLVFGITGMASYYLIIGIFKFLLFIIAPIASILATKVISVLWEKIATSMHYTIAATQNLLGVEGEVVLKVDEYGGVIKIASRNPLKYEKLHVKPYKEGEVFEKGEKVFVVGVKNQILLVNNTTNI
ncbi:MAG: DUF1449 family protein [Candidatus Lokiarchaeota archaeon]